MKRIACLIAAGCFATVPAAADDTTNWSGLYLGAHAGYAWGDASTKDDIKDWCGASDTACIAKYVGPFDFNPDGAFGGATVGWNGQLSRIVFGAEADLGYMDLNGSKRLFSSNGSGTGDVSTTYYQDTSVSGGLYADVTGRLGLTVGPALLYGKGGWAWFDGEAKQASTKPWYQPTGTDTFSGPVYGGGLEVAIGSGWSLKAEYLHFDFGSQGATQEKVASSAPDADDGTLIGTKFNNTQDLSADSVKIGVNYRFNGFMEPLK